MALTKISKRICFFVLLGLVSLSCKKYYPDIEQVDQDNIHNYMGKKQLRMNAYGNTGIYYKIINPGLNTLPVQDTNLVFFTYTLKTLDGKYIATDTVKNRYEGYLGYLDNAHGYPPAWEIAIKEILKNRGGTIQIIIPSRLAYGKKGYQQIPPNACLDCTIHLYTATNQVDFQDYFTQQYIQQNGITGLSKTTDGLYYKIINSGNGTDFIANTSSITVTYTGKLSNHFVFDAKTSYTDVLGSFITGWQEGLPLIRAGGKIRLIIPPALGYGIKGNGTSVPPNQLLDYEITLIKVSN